MACKFSVGPDSGNKYGTGPEKTIIDGGVQTDVRQLAPWIGPEHYTYQAVDDSKGFGFWDVPWSDRLNYGEYNQ